MAFACASVANKVFESKTCLVVAVFPKRKFAQKPPAVRALQPSILVGKPLQAVLLVLLVSVLSHDVATMTQNRARETQDQWTHPSAAPVMQKLQPGDTVVTQGMDFQNDERVAPLEA